MLFRYSGTSISLCGALVDDAGKLAGLIASDDDGDTGTEGYVWPDKRAAETRLLLFSGGVMKPAFSKNNATSSETNFPPGFLLYRCGSMVGTEAMFTVYMMDDGDGQWGWMVYESV